ncbi:hypothetical protein [Cytophaga sp. FL35]|uniref:hypothetical protein n=1 Tax=Cytophaga sp. FL35 TaxID=1904456 RepID=UPI001653CCDC|nr:hypothetical protein [Cytophaga sp. FL35]MBC7000910.1 hypothetical protein [Cytophaga sp. FL35]
MEKKKSKPGIIIMSLLVIVLIIGFYNSWKAEASLSSKGKITIGRVTDFKYSTRVGHIDFKFYVNGELYDTSDPDDSGWPKYVREARAIRHKFYPVEYDSTNPNNSKIQITKKPLGFNELLKNGIKIKGKVENIYPISESYADLHIKYKYLRGNFKFRTRLHMDSLPCGFIDSCKQKEIGLIISKDYPDVNNLYYLSYDRVSMKKAKEQKK